MRSSYAICALIALAPAGPAFAEDVAGAEDQSSGLDISANIGAVSDYRFRGVSLSDKDPALQGGIDVSVPSGWFAGTWASTIADNGGANLEVDLYAGKTGELAGLEYSATVYGFIYPGASSSNYYELEGALAKSIGPAQVKVRVNYSPEQDSLGGDNLYLGAEGNVGIPGTPISLKANVGRENGYYDNKWDWGLAASYTSSFITLSVGYVDTNYSGVNQAGRLAKAGLIVGATARF